MKKSYDGGLLEDKVTDQLRKATASVKCRGCDSIHPLKYRLSRCPVCGYTLLKGSKGK